METSSSTLTAPSNGEQAPEQVPSRLIDRDTVWALFCDHYWDSFQKDRDLILSHIVSVLTMTPTAEPAAPDLLAALQAMIAYDSTTDSLERFADIIKQADAAIVKAKGAT